MTTSFVQAIESLVIEKWFKEPPSLIASMSSKPSIGTTQAFVLQWSKFSQLFPRWVGAIMSNCTEFQVIAYEVENLMSEVVKDPAGDDNHYELLIRLGQSVGLERDEIEGFPILPESSQTFEWLWNKAKDPDWLVGFTAINGLEILGDRNLPKRYGLNSGTGLSPDPYTRSLGLSHDDIEFFEVSDNADAGHGSETVKIIANYTPQERQDEILELLGETTDRLRTMIDAMWKLANGIDDKINDMKGR